MVWLLIVFGMSGLLVGLRFGLFGLLAGVVAAALAAILAAALLRLSVFVAPVASLTAFEFAALAAMSARVWLQRGNELTRLATPLRCKPPHGWPF